MQVKRQFSHIWLNSCFYKCFAADVFYGGFHSQEGVLLLQNISEEETKSEYFCLLALLVLIEYPSGAHNGYFLPSVLNKQTHIYQYCQLRHTDELCELS